MASFKEIVDSSILNVVVPNVVLDFPTKDIEHSAWLSRLRSEGIERERAFFGIFFLFVSFTLFAYMMVSHH